MMPTLLSRRRALILLAGTAAVLPMAAHAAPAPFTSRRIAVRAVGSGPDVVLIPGLGSGPSVWDALVAALPGYRWHLIHVRGFAGLAPAANAQGPLLEPLADEIARYIAAAGLVRPALIGHSMGGTLAMLVALRHPGSAGRLMVVDMLPAGAAMVGGTAEGTGFLARQLRGYFTGTPGGRRAFQSLLRDATPGGADSDPDVIAAALDELASIDLGPRLPMLRLPTTVVPALPREPEDRRLLLDRARSAYAAVPGVRLRPVEASGHMVMLDQPTAFAARVREFLSGA